MLALCTLQQGPATDRPRAVNDDNNNKNNNQHNNNNITTNNNSRYISTFSGIITLWFIPTLLALYYLVDGLTKREIRPPSDD